MNNKSKKDIFSLTIKYAAGEIILSGIALVIFILAGRSGIDTVAGLAAGAVLAIGNFFFMALSLVSLGDEMKYDKTVLDDSRGSKNDGETADMPAISQQEEKVKAKAKIHYLIRMVSVGALLVGCAVTGFFDIIALLIPLLVSRPVLMLIGFIGRKGDEH